MNELRLKFVFLLNFTVSDSYEITANEILKLRAMFLMFLQLQFLKDDLPYHNIRVLQNCVVWFGPLIFYSDYRNNN